MDISTLENSFISPNKKSTNLIGMYILSMSYGAFSLSYIIYWECLSITHYLLMRE